jgi:pimeloyl-ACP methyl ester carboxylesterase
MGRLVMRWIGKRVLRLIGILVFLGVAGALYQVVGNALDRRHYPPTGELIDVGGYRLHLHCTGAGSPTVILGSMSPGWSLYWGTVQPDIAKMTRVCSYDRAGYGWSDPGPAPRSAKQDATELHTLLTNAHVAGSYILVGHSFSGFTVRIFRHEYPNEVAGMVLVDAGQEDVWQYPERRRAHDAFARMLPVARLAGATGSLRLLTALDKSPFLPAKQLQEAPAEIRPMLRAGLARTSFMTTVAQEDAALPDTQSQARDTGALNDLPLIVITANHQAWMSRVPAGVDRATYNSEWLELQRKLLALSSRSTQMFADKSSHYVPFDQPETVVDGVRRVLDTIRTR